MTRRFAHLLLHVPPPRAGEIRPRLAERSWLVAGGPTGIGWQSEEMAAVLPAGPADVERVGADLGDGVEVTAVERLVAVARADDTTRPPAGVLALRWFELAASDWDEFLDLSVGAWGGFEGAHTSKVLGLFRSEDCAEPDARALLVTWYGSLADWETSRRTVGATEGEEAAAGRRFRRRHEITRRSIVRLSPC
ncbi:MAG: hypothetical protein ACRDTP_07220 [Mycobacteriales bacterium]